MVFIGIDLAWTYRNETGICVISADGVVELLDSKIYSNGDILEVIKSHGSDEEICIAIDAPLIVNNESGSRGAEGALMRARIHGHRLSAFNSNRNYFNKVFGDIRGETLRKVIQLEISNVRIGFSDSESNLVETFPTGICCGLFPEIYPVKYKRKPKITFEETCSHMEVLLKRFEEIEKLERHVSGLASRLEVDITALTRKQHKHIEDKIDAFLCAYGMYSIHKGLADGRMFGNVEGGFIMLPVKGEVQNN
ncbi:Predicted nuclease (RNAse H fold) [Salinicoccus halodurans]|uniref:Predicted nuclease (RNAse H fold) n=2 Tax=Salinicoccus halodurans TaxID=407035 RepID=A0A0F7HLW9_9STAP|nr:hypothetical protein AAT16_10550 [Salinicoccus halodurans]SFK89459.1 Predicted nuclease (RNAse H fold) [Salinicoccus halodurans]